MTGVISGVKIPDSKLAQEAAELVRQYENELLFNHSVRVYVFGAIKGIRQSLKFDSELLYIAALFHDLGLIDHYHTETKRFEVDGADAAREFLRSHGIDEPKADLVWESTPIRLRASGRSSSAASWEATTKSAPNTFRSISPNASSSIITALTRTFSGRRLKGADEGTCKDSANLCLWLCSRFADCWYITIVSVLHL